MVRPAAFWPYICPTSRAVLLAYISHGALVLESSLSEMPPPPQVPLAGEGSHDNEVTWYDVGVFRTLFSEVTQYSLPPENGQGTVSAKRTHRSDHGETRWWTCHALTNPSSLLQGKGGEQQDQSGREKRDLAPGVTYRFRVAGINSCGQGNFSPVSEFKTCQPGFPGAPSAVKITKVQLESRPVTVMRNVLLINISLFSPVFFSLVVFLNI